MMDPNHQSAWIAPYHSTYLVLIESVFLVFWGQICRRFSIPSFSLRNQLQVHALSDTFICSPNPISDWRINTNFITSVIVHYTTLRLIFISLNILSATHAQTHTHTGALLIHFNGKKGMAKRHERALSLLHRTRRKMFMSLIQYVVHCSVFYPKQHTVTMQ